MGLGVVLLMATPMQAQIIDRLGEHINGILNDDNHSGGLFNKGGFFSGEANLDNETFGEAGCEIGNEPFGAPIGGGIGILLAAGMGYAFIQSKKNKQN